MQFYLTYLSQNLFGLFLTACLFSLFLSAMGLLVLASIKAGKVIYTLIQKAIAEPKQDIIKRVAKVMKFKPERVPEKKVKNGKG